MCGVSAGFGLLMLLRSGTIMPGPAKPSSPSGPKVTAGLSESIPSSEVRGSGPAAGTGLEAVPHLEGRPLVEGTPKMAARFPAVHKPESSLREELKSLGVELGLQGRDLAEFVVERLDKEEEKQHRRRREEEEMRYLRQREEEDRKREDRWRQREEEERERRRCEKEEERERWGQMVAMLARSGRDQSERMDTYKVRLPEFDDQTDIDHFLEHFERVATLHGWPKDCWGVRLVPLLSGRAREAYLQLEIGKSTDFEQVKAALRRRFTRDANHYRKQFRETRKTSEETFPQFSLRLRTIVKKWAEIESRDLTDSGQVLEMFLHEQLLSTLHGDIEIRVREAALTSVEEVASLAQRLLDARQEIRSPTKSGRGTDVEEKGAAPSGESPEGQGTCHVCKKGGHWKRNCPEVKKAYCVLPAGGRDTGLEKSGFADFMGTCKVNGEESQLVRDTGADMCMVEADLVNDEDYLGKSVRVQLANSQESTVPLAKVKLESDYARGDIVVAALPRLAYPVIMGNQGSRPNGEKFSIPIRPGQERLPGVPAGPQHRPGSCRRRQTDSWSHRDLSNTVYVGGLGHGCSKNELGTIFSKHGRLRRVWIARKPEGFAFVEFDDPRDAEKAVEALEGVPINGKRTRVEMSTGRTRFRRGGCRVHCCLEDGSWSCGLKSRISS